MPNFIGYSTAIRDNYGNSRKVVFDKELAIQDLLNEIYTRKGEAPMKPDFGFIGHNYIMENLTPGIVDILEYDVKRIIGNDSRFIINSINVVGIEHGFSVNCDLTYFDQTPAKFSAAFDSRMFV